jgi:hypothetical protein
MFGMHPLKAMTKPDNTHIRGCDGGVGGEVAGGG